MFSDQIISQANTTDQSQQRVQSYYGVDLTSYQCYQLKPNSIFSNYKNEDVHFAITAMQKGQKPPSKIGIKRTKRRNYKRKQAIEALVSRKISIESQDPNEKEPAYIKPLNPKSPEQICLKALRRQFREQIAPTVMQDEKSSVASGKKSIKKTQQQKNANRRPKFIRKKQNQLRRRLQLITLVNQNREILSKIFGARLRGFHNKSKCPQVSRQQIKDALTKHYQQKIEKINNPNIEKINQKIAKRNEVKKRTFQRFQQNHSDEYRDDSEEQSNLIVRRGSGRQQHSEDSE